MNILIIEDKAKINNYLENRENKISRNITNKPEKNLYEMSLDELQSKENALKKMIPFLTGAVLLLMGVGIYLTLKQGFGIFTVLPLIVFSLFIRFLGALLNVEKTIIARSEYH